MKAPSPVRITESSGNVFADLGLPNPEQELRKARDRKKQAKKPS
jgi:hypothetical protein